MGRRALPAVDVLASVLFVCGQQEQKPTKAGSLGIELQCELQRTRAFCGRNDAGTYRDTAPETSRPVGAGNTLRNRDLAALRTDVLDVRDAEISSNGSSARLSSLRQLRTRTRTDRRRARPAHARGSRQGMRRKGSALPERRSGACRICLESANGSVDGREVSGYPCHSTAPRREYSRFLILSHALHGPARYGASMRFATIPS